MFPEVHHFLRLVVALADDADADVVVVVVTKLALR